MHWTCRNTTKYELGFALNPEQDIASARSVPAQPEQPAEPSIPVQALRAALYAVIKKYPDSATPIVQWITRELEGKNK